MFSGIVQRACPVLTNAHSPGRTRLTLQLGELSADLQLGASVAVSGVCLSAVSVKEGRVEFDVIQETLDRTTLGNLRAGDWVNIERALRVGDEIGGHHVTGHIDTTGEVVHIEEAPGNREMWVSFPAECRKFLMPKGWIALHGVSLTVVQVKPALFSVALIPETLERTTLGAAHVGTPLHLEFDHHTKVIVQTLEQTLPEMLSSLRS